MYAIPACDTVKKARDWLAANGVEYEFHDYKKLGASLPILEQAIAEHGWEVVLNRAGTTFRKLPDDARANLDARKAVDLMLAQPSMIKRPIVVVEGLTLVGFKPEAYAATFLVRP
jgi:arsenate reductase